MTSPEKQIELLKRKLDREKRARALAESQLEDYSREIYLTNEYLKKNLVRTSKRRIELEFLHNTSSMVNSELSITELLKGITAYIANFVNARAGGFYIASQSVKIDGEESLVWTSEKTWHSDPELFQVFSKHIQLKGTLDTKQWLLAPLGNGHKNDIWASTILVYKHYSLDADSSAIIAFLTGDEGIEEEVLYSLDTASDHLISGLRRRLAEQRILRRNTQLEDTIARLETAQQQLIQSEKMASLGLLAAGVAHEINNPVGFIKANMTVLNEYQDSLESYLVALNEKIAQNEIDASELQKLLEKFDIPFLVEDSKDIVKTNLDGIQRVTEIVNGLKTYSHAGDNKQALIPITECIDSALKVVTNELKYQHQVEKSLPENLPQIFGNSGQLQQVFINLFVNAAHAMPDGGELSIHGTVEENNQDKKTHLLITVADTGTGMTEDQKNKLFMPFFTTKAVGTGTGLGLSVSHAILEAHNVNVTVDSEIGFGTTFYLRFPIPEQI